MPEMEHPAASTPLDCAVDAISRAIATLHHARMMAARDTNPVRKDRLEQLQGSLVVCQENCRQALNLARLAQEAR